MIQSVPRLFSVRGGCLLPMQSGAYAGAFRLWSDDHSSIGRATDSTIKIGIRHGFRAGCSDPFNGFGPHRSSLPLTRQSAGREGCELTSVVRSSVSLAGTATLSGVVSESGISKTDVLDPSRAVALSTSVDGLRIRAPTSTRMAFLRPEQATG